MAEKVRVHHMARELSVSSKTILEKCRAEDVDLKNHMSTVTAGLAATIRDWFSKGAHDSSVETATRVDLDKARVKRRPLKAKVVDTAPVEPSLPPGEAATAVAEAPEPVAPVAPASVDLSAPEPVVAVEAEVPAPVMEATPAALAAPPPASEVAELPVLTETEPAGGPTVPVVELERPAAEAPVAPTDAPASDEPGPPDVAEETPVEPPQPSLVGPQNVPAPAQLVGPRVIRVESPEPVPSSPPRPRYRPARPPARGPAEPPMVTPGSGRRGRPPGAGTDAGAKKSGRARLHPRRSTGRGTTGGGGGDGIREWRDRDLAERQERLQQAKERGTHSRRAVESRGGHIVAPRRTQVAITVPLPLHEFCNATGLSMRQLMPKLIKELGALPNRNTAIDGPTAELLTIDFGIELEAVQARTALKVLEDEHAQLERAHVENRPPIVTFLGHVDHGKTSLLDAIRKERVAAGEAGGITQHIGAYRLEREEGAVTFLDTPGHEAFTAMRARGAQMTDVVVLVVAVDDGVMPQTIEAINHARAAEVAVVVALNKIDLPGVDINRVYGQLAEHQLVPVEWGGEVDVIRTSATTGEGIDTLLDHLSTLSELLELKADPTILPKATVVEAEMREGVGVVARVLIQEGTLRNGAFIVCGPGAGRVRSMKDHRGKTVSEAGPATPIEMAGLDALPSAGDRLYAVESLQRAKSIAEEVRHERREAALLQRQKPKSLEEMLSQRDADEIPELNLIIKADAQGSVDVLKKTLGEIKSDDARLTILHAAVGGVSESDVVLAQASNAAIIGFHVIADPMAQRLADEKGVSVRLYRIIYELLDSIRGALEGIMIPELRIESRGRAEVRQIFRVSNLGMVAGCLVTEGSIMRNHKIRLVRDLKIQRDDAGIGSLRRFKEDVREVKAGLECGIRIDGYDDVHPGDVIEAYEVVEIKRTL